MFSIRVTVTSGSLAVIATGARANAISSVRADIIERVIVDEARRKLPWLLRMFRALSAVLRPDKR